MSAKLLVVEDDASQRAALGELARQIGYECEEFSNAEDVAELRIARLAEFDAGIIDWDLPGINGTALARQLHQRNELLDLVMLTAHTSKISRNAALAEGFLHYIKKPGTENLKKYLREQQPKWSAQRIALRKLQDPGTGIVGPSDALATLRQEIVRIAAEDRNVLLLGETGTGKDLVARKLCELSPRGDRSLIILNAASVNNEALADSEFFGIGARVATGVAESEGAFRAADGGTLFLDEVGELSLPVQAKLLRALANKVVKTVGRHDEEKVDVRVITATNRNLPEMVSNGAFREDLYNRLAEAHIFLTPLRDRPEDILPLAEHQLALELKKLRMRKPGLLRKQFSPEVRKRLKANLWLGNVRVLQSVIGEAVSRSRDRTFIIESDLQFPPATGKVSSHAGGPVTAGIAAPPAALVKEVREFLDPLDAAFPIAAAARGDAEVRLEDLAKPFGKSRAAISYFFNPKRFYLMRGEQRIEIIKYLAQNDRALWVNLRSNASPVADRFD